MKRVGFVGLGNIGRPMAERLVAAGFETAVADLRREAVDALVERGARAPASLAELAAGCDVVGVCVRDDDDVRGVVGGPEGLAAAASAGAVIAVHSTVLPSTVRALAREAEARGVALVDACVSGGAAGAARGALTVMVGGDDEAVARCRPYLEAFASRVIATGPLGSGAAAKLCNNLMTYLAWTAAFEARTLALAAGLPEDVFEAVTSATGNLTDPMRAFLALHKAPAEARRSEGFQRAARGFVEVAEKDLAGTLALAREHGLALPGAGLASQLMARVYGLEDTGRR